MRFFFLLFGLICLGAGLGIDLLNRELSSTPMLWATVTLTFFALVFFLLHIDTQQRQRDRSDLFSRRTDPTEKTKGTHERKSPPPAYALFRRREFGPWQVRFRHAGKIVRRSCWTKNTAAAHDAARCWLRHYARTAPITT